jgi:type II secretory pathway component PulC
MSEAKRKKIVYLALVAAIIYGAVNFWPNQPEAPKEYKTIAPLTAQQIALQKASRTANVAIDFARYDSLQWGGDPFRADQKVTNKVTRRKTTTFELSGIIYSPDYPLAVINRKTVGVGDKVDNARVKKIEKTKVILDHNGTELTLTVNRG